jgi:hypothetical protein
MKMIAGAILLLAASILWGKFMDHRYAAVDGPFRLMSQAAYFLLVPTIILALAGVILLLGFPGKPGGRPKS